MIHDETNIGHKRQGYGMETATKLASWNNGLMLSELFYCVETLYLNQTGEYFLHVRGGCATKYGVFDGEGWDDGEEIVPLTVDKAEDWVGKYCSEKYEVIFGDGDKAV